MYQYNENYYLEVIKPQVLRSLQLNRVHGNQYTDCICNRGKSENGKDFSINADNGMYNCFSGNCGLDKKSGNCYDLARILNISIEHKANHDSDTVSLSPNISIKERNKKYTNQYDYRNENGQPVYGKVRYYYIDNPDKKGFYPYIYDKVGNKVFTWEKEKYRKVEYTYPYNFDRITKKLNEKTLEAIVILEGEKCCDIFYKFMSKDYPNIIPTTNFHGASKTTKMEIEYLLKIPVEIPKIIIRDNDGAGLKHQESILKLAKRSDFISFDISQLNLSEKEDIAEYFQVYHKTADDLMKHLQPIINEYEPDNSSVLAEISNLDTKSIIKRASEYMDTDYLNRSKSLNSGNFMFCSDEKNKPWYHWNSKMGVWKLDERNTLIEVFIEEVENSIADDIKIENNDTKKKKLMNHLKKFKKTNLPPNLLKAITEGSKYLMVSKDFNKKTNCIPCSNGKTIDFSGLEPIVYDSKKEDFFVYTLNADYDENAECPNWIKFLKSCHDDEGILKLLQEICGASLIGDTSYGKFFFFYGNGANGKSIFISVFSDIMGEYFKVADQSLIEFSEYGFTNSPKDAIGRLKGARFVVAQETSYGKILNEKTLKILTGGEKMAGGKMYQATFEFTPELTLIIHGNYKPNLQSISDGLARRLVIIPWEKSFKTDSPNYRPGNLLKKELMDETSGILNWALDGLKRLKQNSMVFTIPDKVKEITEGYIKEFDSVTQFIEIWCKIESVDEIEDSDYSRFILRNRKSIYEDYKNFCNENNFTSLSKNLFHEKVLSYRIKDDHSGLFKIIPHIEGEYIKGYKNLRSNYIKESSF